MEEDRALGVREARASVAPEVNALVAPEVRASLVEVGWWELLKVWTATC